MRVEEASTPALVLDRDRLARNAERMSRRANEGGVSLRPHLKTAKSARVAAIATAGHPGGITVSTLAEAEYFLERGLADLTYAVCIVPHKLERVDALQRRGARIKLITDSAAVAAELSRRAPALAHPLEVLVEIDCGEHRTGVSCGSDALLDIAATLHQCERIELAGVLTHGGHSYACRSVEAIRAVAEEERRAAVRAAERLRAAGLPCPIVSAGSTPTAVHAESFAGLTEIRPGVYLFFDLAQYGKGSCELGDLALSVAARVISHRPEHGRLLIDAGGLALSKDQSAADRVPDAGYGWVMDATLTRRIGDLRVSATDQEHGFVEGSAIPYEELPIGSLVRVLPNHACMTAAAYSHYLVADGTGEVVDTWDRAGGW